MHVHGSNIGFGGYLASWQQRHFANCIVWAWQGPREAKLKWSNPFVKWVGHSNSISIFWCKFSLLWCLRFGYGSNGAYLLHLALACECYIALVLKYRRKYMFWHQFRKSLLNANFEPSGSQCFHFYSRDTSTSDFGALSILYTQLVGNASYAVLFQSCVPC